MKRILLLLFLCISSLWAQGQINVAVNDLRSHGIGSDETAIISDRVRSELIGTGQFRVMERGEMNMILEEQGFQQSGMCSDASCLVEVGQILAVERIITGSIGLIGTMYTLNLKMVNVENGEILATSTVDFHGEISGFLSQSVPQGVVQLINGKSGSSNSTAIISIFSEPAGADISINGTVIGETPLEKKAVSAGEVAMIITKRGYSPVDSTFYLGNMQNKTISLTLVPDEKSSPRKNKVFKVLGFTVGGALTVTGALMGMAFDEKLKEFQNEYDASTEEHVITEARSKMEDAVIFRNVSYVAAGAGAALVGVSFFF